MAIKYNGTRNKMVLFPKLTLSIALLMEPTINTSNKPITNKPSFKSFL